MQPGISDGENTPEAPPAFDEAPFEYNFIPNPAVHGDEIDSTRLWGFDMTELCVY